MLTLLIIGFFICLIRKRKKHRKPFKAISEKKLYELIKNDYPSAIYQYRCKWLGRQSYDIYIPEKKIAIEYQGQQHFRSISYFGGRKQYKRQRKLDKIKKRKSREHNITLLYFTFDKSAPNRFLLKKVYKDYDKLRKRIRLNWIYRII